MTYHPRVVVARRPHHVITSGNNLRRLFSYPPEYRRFISCLAHGLAATGCELHQLSLMNSHVELIVTPPAPAELPRFMKATCAGYAQTRNRRRGGCGKLFQAGYRAFPLLTDEEVAVATVFADLASVRAGRQVDAFDDEWSTYTIHAGVLLRGALLPALWQPSGWYRSLGDTPAARAASYSARVAQFGTLRPAYARVIERIESRSTKPYTRRVLRPDETSAREAASRYGAGGSAAGSGDSVSVAERDRERDRDSGT